MGIARLDACTMTERGAAARIQLAQHHVAAEHDIPRRKWRAVVPPHIALEMKGIGELVGRDFEAFGEVGPRLELPVKQEQGLVDIAADLLRQPGIVEGIVQRRRLIREYGI